MRCNLCGGRAFTDMPKRPAVRCAACGSLERTRVAGLHVDQLALPPRATILHFAPELGLHRLLKAIGGDRYRALDIDPSLYPGRDAEPFDLCRDVFNLPAGEADLIVHNHVLEHLECNWTAVLVRLARALKPAGTMLFSMPVLPGDFTDALTTAPRDEKLARFGPMLHVRRFSPEHLQATLGMVFHIPERHDLTARFPPAVLEEANVPAHHWHGYTGTTVFRVTPAELRL